MKRISGFGVCALAVVTIAAVAVAAVPTPGLSRAAVPAVVQMPANSAAWAAFDSAAPHAPIGKELTDTQLGRVRGGFAVPVPNEWGFIRDPSGRNIRVLGSTLPSNFVIENRTYNTPIHVVIYTSSLAEAIPAPYNSNEIIPVNPNIVGSALGMAGPVEHGFFGPGSALTAHKDNP